MINEQSASTRKVKVHITDNGTPFAHSITTHKNIKINAEVQPPLQLPGLIVFVHGVNSEGEWYDHAENSLCEGLNVRLGLSESCGHGLKPNKYYSSHWNDDKSEWVVPPRKIKEDGRSPVIAGVLHDSAHGDHVTIRNYKRNVLRTPANNKIRLEDERGKEHIKVSTEYGGKSQLNLGHLVDAEKQKRGEGFELRTDSWGAIRAQKGLFITADGQPKAQGQVLEMGASVSNLSDAREQMTSISADAQKATANPADLRAKIKLLEKQLTDLKKSVLLFSAPEGMAMSSGQHLQVSAGQNLIATAGKNADVSVVKNLFIGVGNALSVFVRKLGIKLIANQGPVQVQAQNDLMALLARKEISIVSTEDEIKIIAKKKLTLNGGGSYITLDVHAIESATAGEYRTRAGHYDRKTRAQNKPEMDELPPKLFASYNRVFNFKDENGNPYAETKYYALMNDGTEISGMTDENGNTRVFSGKGVETVRVHLAI